MDTFVKVRFISKQHGATAGLILTLKQIRDITVADLSRMYPYSVANKMERLQKSQPYPTWNEAFNHTFSD